MNMMNGPRNFIRWFFKLIIHNIAYSNGVGTFDAFNPNLPFMRHSIKSPCSDFTVYQLPVDLYTSPVMLQDKILFEV
jgi:hypothetical protein